MRKTVTAVIAAYMLTCCFLSSQAWAQCKPDYSGADKITKERIDAWTQVLSKMGSLLSTSQITIYASVVRQGNGNIVRLTFIRVEASATNQALESQYLADVGKPFYLGLKNGQPLEFVVTEVENNSRTQKSLISDTKGTSVIVYVAAVSNKAMATLRQALTSQQIDAVRMTLAGDVRIEASVDDKTGKRMMEKFSCFYQSLDQQGIDLSTAVDPPAKPGQPASAAGKQAEPQKPAAQLTIDQVIQMVAAKLADDIIITAIRNSSSKFDLTPDVLIKLKTAGVSDEVIRAMTK